MKNDQFAVYRVNRNSEGRDLWHLSYQEEMCIRDRYEDLPIIPEEWKLAVSKDKKEQFYILKKLLNRPDIELSLIHI